MFSLRRSPRGISTNGVNMHRRRVGSLSSNESRPAPTHSPTTSTHAHVSTYRSPHMEIQLYSQTVRVQDEKRGSWAPLPVFSDGDQVSGRIILDPSCSHSGRLSISIEGAFIFSLEQQSDDASIIELTPARPRKKHVFYSATNDIPVTSPFESNPRSAFREAFSASVRRRPSASSLNLGSNPPAERSYPFNFDLPRSRKAGEEMPPSFTDAKAESDAEAFEVVYKVVATWEAYNTLPNPTSLEVPILFHPDPDFHSADAQAATNTSWLEMPLRSDRPIPFRCAVTLPTSVTFSRNSSIPYFVVFTTTPRSTALAKEIAADATISVSLHRQVTILENMTLPPTPPDTPPSSGDDSEPSRSRLLKRIRRPRARTLDEIPPIQETYPLLDKPLPRLPTQTVFSEYRSLQNSICIGFPKRPRHPSDNKTHPPLDSVASLPDGLYKAKIFLDKEMLQCVDWETVSVKYYLDVSVLIGQDDLRARIPIRIY